MKVKSESQVAQSCPTPSDPMDCSLPGSSAHGICQAEYWTGTHAKLGRMKELGGKTGVLLGLDLPLAGGGN